MFWTTINFVQKVFQIKNFCYGKTLYVRFVRGPKKIGANKFRVRKNVVRDLATGLKWMQKDSGFYEAGSKNNGKMDWSEALKVLQQS